MNNIAEQYLECDLENLKNETLEILKLNLKNIEKFSIGNFRIQNHNISKILLIGAKGSGKRSLLSSFSTEHNDLSLISDHECQTVFNNNMAIFNIPGEFSTNEYSIKYWQDIFKIFAYHNPKNPIDGITLTLNLHELIHQPKATKSKHHLHLQNILYLASNFSRRLIPVHVVITHMDILVGFKEFFKDISFEELKKTWGLKLPSNIPPNSLERELSDSFEKMQKKIETHLYWQLNHLASPKDASLAYEFPLHFNSTKEAIINSIKQIFTNNVLRKFDISGIFFVSNDQTNKQTDYFSQYTKEILPINLFLTKKNELVKKPSFFIKNLFQNDIPKKTKEYIPVSNISRYKSNIPVICTILILLFLVVTTTITSIRNDISNLKNINNKLIDYRIQLHSISKEQNKTSELVKMLNHLEQIDTLSKELNSYKIVSYLFPSIKKLKNNLVKLDNKTRHEIISPFIFQKLENSLKLSISNKNPIKTFEDLKAYLMLESKDLFDSSYLSERISEILGDDPFIETNYISQLKPMLSKILSSSPKLKINQNLIFEAKTILISQPIIHLVYSIFEKKIYSGSNITDNLYSEVIFVPSHMKSINFVNYFDKLIPMVCEDFLRNFNKVEKSSVSLKFLVKAVQNEYIQKYTMSWQNYISSLLPNTQINNTDSIDSVLQQLNTSIQHLGTAINLITANTTPLIEESDSANIFNNLISQKLQKDSAHFYIVDDSFGIALDKIKIYYNKLKKSSNQDELIFREVRKVFLNNNDNIFANILSSDISRISILNRWLYKFGQSLWAHHLTHAQKHIQNKWNKDIYPTFKNNISKKYPFVRKSTKEVSLQNFSNFFSPYGKMTNFYKNYIKPFYNTKNAKWQQTDKYDSKLPFISNVSEIFIKSQLIQTMFFKNNKLSVPFSITSTKIKPIIRKVELVVNNKKIIYKHGKQNTVSLTWPFKSPIIHLMLETTNNNQTSDIFNSNWGFFKLLDKVKVSPINKKEYQILFIIDNNTATFKISFNKAINPLNKGVIENYKLPMNLFKNKN